MAGGFLQVHTEKEGSLLCCDYLFIVRLSWKAATIIVAHFQCQDFSQVKFGEQLGFESIDRLDNNHCYVMQYCLCFYVLLTEGEDSKWYPVCGERNDSSFNMCKDLVVFHRQWVRWSLLWWTTSQNHWCIMLWEIIVFSSSTHICISIHVF